MSDTSTEQQVDLTDPTFATLLSGLWVSEESAWGGVNGFRHMYALKAFMEAQGNPERELYSTSMSIPDTFKCNLDTALESVEKLVANGEAEILGVGKNYDGEAEDDGSGANFKISKGSVAFSFRAAHFYVVLAAWDFGREDNWWIQISSPYGREEGDEWAQHLAHYFYEKLSSPTEVEPEKDFPLMFMSAGPQGLQYTNMQSPSYNWDDISGNYIDGEREKIDRLMDFDITQLSESASGRLVVLHGPPGTGKTHVISALMTRWRNDVAGYYCLDPSMLLEHPNHIVEFLMHKNERYGNVRPPWKCIVLEDSDRYLKQGDGTTTGLSNLFNLCDGLIGRTSKVLVLVTTNVDVRSWNKAVTRPGRCLADIRFEKFNRTDSNAWLESHGVNVRVDEEKTLAELYEILNESEKITSAREEEVHGQYL